MKRIMVVFGLTVFLFSVRISAQEPAAAKAIRFDPQTVSLPADASVKQLSQLYADRCSVLAPDCLLRQVLKINSFDIEEANVVACIAEQMPDCREYSICGQTQKTLPEEYSAVLNAKLKAQSSSSSFAAYCKIMNEASHIVLSQGCVEPSYPSPGQIKFSAGNSATLSFCSGSLAIDWPLSWLLYVDATSGACCVKGEDIKCVQPGAEVEISSYIGVPRTSLRLNISKLKSEASDKSCVLNYTLDRPVLAPSPPTP